MLVCIDGVGTILAAAAAVEEPKPQTLGIPFST